MTCTVLGDIMQSAGTKESLVTQTDNLTFYSALQAHGELSALVLSGYSRPETPKYYSIKTTDKYDA